MHFIWLMCYGIRNNPSQVTPTRFNTKKPMKNSTQHCYPIRNRRLHRPALAWLAVGIAMACGVAVRAESVEQLEQQALHAAVASVEDAVVQIRAIGGLERVDKVLLAQGPTTGLIISPDGYIVSSAFNFAQQPTSILVRLSGDEQLPARVVARDWSRMLVLLKVEPKGPLPTAEAAPVDSMRVGQWAVAVGRTFRADRVDVSVGIVSALRRKFGRVLQTDANISTANYGGPLIDIRGRVLGVLVPMSPQPSSPQSKSEVAGAQYYDSGIGFAVPLAHLLAVLDRWKQGEDLHPGLLGIGLARGGPFVTPAKITTVWPNSPAAKAGWKPDDTIVAIAGRPVETQSQLRFEIVPRYAGERVRVTIQRGDEMLDTEVTLTDRLAVYRHPFLGILPQRPGHSHQPADVAVRSVLPDSPAAAAGLHAGDRITKIGDETVRTIDDALQALDTHHPGEEIAVTFSRDNAGTKAETETEAEAEAELAGEQTVRLQLATLPTDIPDRTLLPPAIETANRNESTGENAGENAADDQNAGNSKPSGANSPPPFQLQPLKLLEFSQTASVLRPKKLDADRSYGILIWLAESQQEQIETRADAWKSLCQRDGLILVQPQPKDPTGWASGDMEYLGKLVRTITGKLQADPRRVIVAGRGKAGQLAYAFALRSRRTVRAIVAVDAPLPRTIKIPENQPGQRLAVLSLESQETPFSPLLRADRHRLQEAGYPATQWKLSGSQLTPGDRKAIARWLDALDRL